MTDPAVIEKYLIGSYEYQANVHGRGVWSGQQKCIDFCEFQVARKHCVSIGMVWTTMMRAAIVSALSTHDQPLSLKTGGNLFDGGLADSTTFAISVCEVASTRFAMNEYLICTRWAPRTGPLLLAFRKRGIDWRLLSGRQLRLRISTEL